MQDPPHLPQCEPRIRHMIESVTAYDQIGTAVQQGKSFRSQSQMDGSAADCIFDQHSELLIDVQKRVDRDFDGPRECREITSANRSRDSRWSCCRSIARLAPSGRRPLSARAENARA